MYRHIIDEYNLVPRAFPYEEEKSPGNEIVINKQSSSSRYSS